MEQNGSQGAKTEPRAVIRLSMIGAFLTVINTAIASLALGVFQGFIVAFTTPFAFALGRLLHPRLPAATIIYVPVVVVSIFTANFGIIAVPAAKLVFIVSSIIYDLLAYVVGVHRHTSSRVPLWKLLVPTLFYPVGLLLSALIIIASITVELPIISKGWIGAVVLLVFFGVMGTFATFVCHRVFYRWIKPANGEPTHAGLAES